MKRKDLLLRIIASSLSLGINGFIIYHSCLSGSSSVSWSNPFATYIKDEINENHSEKIETVNVNDIEISLSDYKYNYIDGYLDNQMPVGTIKGIVTNVLPANATNQSVTYETEDNDKCNIILKGNNACFIEAKKAGPITIKAKSVDNPEINKTYNFEILPSLLAPLDFDVSIDNDVIGVGLTNKINVTIKNETLQDNPLLTCRYYDLAKLSFVSSDYEVCDVDVNGVIKAKKEGTSNITISNGRMSKQISITVSGKPELIYPNDNWEIIGNDTCYYQDLDYDITYPNEFFTHLEIDWKGHIPTDASITWSSSDPLVAKVDDKGNVRGFKNINNEDDIVLITATSNMDKTISKTFLMNVKVAKAKSMSLSEQGEITFINKPSAHKDIKASFLPLNTFDLSISATSSDESIASVISSGDTAIIYAHKVGKVTISITSNSNSSLKQDVTINIKARGLINEDNIDTFKNLVRKTIGHFFLFTASAILTTWAIYLIHRYAFKYNNYMSFSISMLMGVTIAFISEGIQLFTPGRGGSIIDVLIDSSGYLLGILLYWLILILIKLILRRKNSNAK